MWVKKRKCIQGCIFQIKKIMQFMKVIINMKNRTPEYILMIIQVIRLVPFDIGLTKSDDNPPIQMRWRKTLLATRFIRGLRYWLPGIAAPEAINQTKNAIAARKMTVGAIALLFTCYTFKGSISMAPSDGWRRGGDDSTSAAFISDIFDGGA